METRSTYLGRGSGKKLVVAVCCFIAPWGEMPHHSFPRHHCPSDIPKQEESVARAKSLTIKTARNILHPSILGRNFLSEHPVIGWLSYH